jgi:hypothetical protein
MTHGQVAFGTTGTISESAFKISPLNSRLHKNLYGPSYTEFSDYSSINALPNPRYKNTSGYQKPVASSQAPGG